MPKQSMQTAAPGSKSMKMVNALDPFEGFLGREKSSETTTTEQQTLTQAMDNRLRISSNTQNAVPATPAMMQQQQQQVIQQQQAVPTSNQNANNTVVPSNKDEKKDKDEDQSDDDSDLEEFDDDLEDDPILEQIRQKRLAQLKNAHLKQASLQAKGHGQVRIISQDEFLAECTSSHFVVVHFFHKEFERCRILNMHLKQIAATHLNAKFVEIDAEKAPFFVVKLKVQTLPTLIVFQDGKAIARLTGFEDLMQADDNNHTIDEFPTSRLGYWLQDTGCIEYEGNDDDDDEKDSASKTTKPKTSMHRYATYDEDV